MFQHQRNPLQLEDVSVTFDPDLTDDAVGRQFILFTVIMREKILVFEDVRESPVEGVFEGTFACEVEAAKSIKHRHFKKWITI